MQIVMQLHNRQWNNILNIPLEHISQSLFDCGIVVVTTILVGPCFKHGIFFK